ncbi:MAG: chloride channel protein [Bacteroidales bacterium]
MSIAGKLRVKLMRWRLKNISPRNLIFILSILIGLITGLVAVLLKYTVHAVYTLVKSFAVDGGLNFYYVGFPIVGIGLTLLFMKYIIKSPIRHGIPNILHSISKRNCELSKHNLYSPIITSALTVGFGGSVGLEGPSVGSGAAYGTYIAKYLRLNYRSRVLLMACACAGAMSAILKAPIAAVVFAVEVIMIDLTAMSLIPLLLASCSAVLVSYLFQGQEALYPITLQGQHFNMADLAYFILLGIVCGLFSAYFTKVYLWVEEAFEGIKARWKRLIYGGILLGIIIFIFPSLYGEGYEVVNECMRGDFSHLFTNSIFSNMHENLLAILLLLFAVVILKAFATSLTFGAGGVGGIFAPSLFMGVHVGLLFSLSANQILEYFGMRTLQTGSFALVGMAGLMAGVLHAPLTGMFLIADISGGYQLFVPLMITATVSSIIARRFYPNSVYHFQLAKRKELITHDKDSAVLTVLSVEQLIETDFITLRPEDKLRSLIEAISNSNRNIFPVVDGDGLMKGMLKMDDVKHLIFNQELYDEVEIKDIMYMPEAFVSSRDSMETLMRTFEKSGRYNIAVIDDGMYKGFISRAKAFMSYRSALKRVSQ